MASECVEFQIRQMKSFIIELRSKCKQKPRFVPFSVIVYKFARDQQTKKNCRDLNTSKNLQFE